MAHSFEFIVEKGFHFASAFGDKFEMPVSADRVYLPEYMGTGYIQEIYLKHGLSLCLHHYRLKEELSLKRLESSSKTENLSIKFYCRKTLPISGKQKIKLFTTGCEVELGTANFFTEIVFPVGENIDFLVINTTREVLVELLQLGDEDLLLQTSLLTNPSFVVNLQMTLEMENTLLQFSKIEHSSSLSKLLFQVKTLELIYLLFEKLTEKVSKTETIISRIDADKLFQVRSLILADLSVAPNLDDLAKRIFMSPTKMKILFRQIFMDTIYNYFQTARMKEAANLLKEFSVSETGYKLGFSNLSHFSRLFEKHFEMKPKKYSDAQN